MMSKTVLVFFVLLSAAALASASTSTSTSANPSTEKTASITPRQSYFDYRPEWGVELSGSSKEVGERALSAALEGRL